MARSRAPRSAKDRARSAGPPFVARELEGRPAVHPVRRAARARGSSVAGFTRVVKPPEPSTHRPPT